MSKVVVKVPVTAEMISEGSYAELVQVYGYEFAISFIDSEIIVRGTASLAYDRRPAWQVQGAAKLAKAHAADQIESYGEEYMSKHVALYAE